jgi:hypothetical protein
LKIVLHLLFLIPALTFAQIFVGKGNISANYQGASPYSSSATYSYDSTTHSFDLPLAKWAFTDTSQIAYYWNSTTSSWVFSFEEPTFTEVFPTGTVVSSFDLVVDTSVSLANTQKTLSVYDNTTKLTSDSTFNWTSDQWLLSSYNVYSYLQNGSMKSYNTYNYTNGTSQLNSYVTYAYNTDGLTIADTLYNLPQSLGNTYSYDVYHYDQNNNLISTINYICSYPIDNPSNCFVDYKSVFSYNTLGFVSSITGLLENSTTNQFYNSNLITYNIDNNNSITSINKTSTNRSITVYPNPSTGKIFISDLSFLIGNSLTTVNVYDISGILKKETSWVNNSIDLSDQSEGIYFVQTYSSTGNQYYKVLIHK